MDAGIASNDRSEIARFDPTSAPTTVLGLSLASASTDQLIAKVGEIEGAPQGVARELLIREIVRRLRQGESLAAELVRDVGSRPAIEQKAVLYALGRSGTASGRAELMRLASGADAALLKHIVLAALQEGSDPNSGAPMKHVVAQSYLDHYAGKPDPDVVSSLIEFDRSGADAQLRAAFYVLMDAYLRSPAAKAETEAAKRALDRVFEHATETLRTRSDVNARQDALSLLHVLPGDRSTRALVGVLGSSEDEDTRYYAALNVGGRDLRDAPLVEFLGITARENSPKIKEACLRSLCETSVVMSEPRSVESLVSGVWGLYHATLPENQRRLIMEILASSAGSAADPYLARISSDDPSEQIRSNAAACLSRRSP